MGLVFPLEEGFNTVVGEGSKDRGSGLPFFEVPVVGLIV